MEETSEDEEYALNSWQQYEQQASDNECEVSAEGESNCGVTGGAGGGSFWSSAESDTGSVIRVEITKGITFSNSLLFWNFVIKFPLIFFYR